MNYSKIPLEKRARIAQLHMSMARALVSTDQYDLKFLTDDVKYLEVRIKEEWATCGEVKSTTPLDEAEKLVAKGGFKIRAIQMLRARVFGLGLKEAKDSVEAYIANPT